MDVLSKNGPCGEVTGRGGSIYKRGIRGNRGLGVTDDILSRRLPVSRTFTGSQYRARGPIWRLLLSKLKEP